MGVSISPNLVTSTITIEDAVLVDAGLYSCTLQAFSFREFPRARARVFIIQGINNIILTSYN